MPAQVADYWAGASEGTTDIMVSANLQVVDSQCWPHCTYTLLQVECASITLLGDDASNIAYATVDQATLSGGSCAGMFSMLKLSFRGLQVQARWWSLCI